MKNSYKKSKQSFITPAILKRIVSQYNFNPHTLTGGDLDGAKTEVLSLTDKHKFINPRHKRLIIEAIHRSYNMVELYTALYNMMHARNNPNEKLTGVL
jgi:hypothetical protein